MLPSRLIMSIDRIPRIPNRNLKIDGFVAVSLVDHRSVHNRGEQKKLLVFGVGRFVDGHCRLHVDRGRRQVDVVGDLCADGHQQPRAIRHPLAKARIQTGVLVD